MARKKRNIPDAPEQVTGNGSQEGKPPRRSRATIAHAELVPGTLLAGSLKGQTLTAAVVLGDQGKPRVEFDGARYPSLSAAGKAAAGYPVNGWRFWRPVTEQPAE